MKAKQYRERRAKEKARRDREAAIAREKHLDSLAGRESKLWGEVDAFVKAMENGRRLTRAGWIAVRDATGADGAYSWAYPMGTARLPGIAPGQMPPVP